MEDRTHKEVPVISEEGEENPQESLCVSRRKMLIMGGLATLTTLLPPGLIQVADAAGKGKAGDKKTAEKKAEKAAPVALQGSRYPRKKVGQVSALKVDDPVTISYPGNHQNHKALLIKLGVPALGGVGHEKDIVAFNTLCTHQGGPLEDRYNAEHKVLGPCEFHLSTFDLARHGMLTQGSASQNLPQVVLEVEGDDIFAVGMQGLIYGFPDNLMPV
jgi:arsenite oxidase small subunit